MVRAAAFLSLVLVAAGAAGAGISGVASVTDGDTLKVGAERIRLHGIDAPESRLGRAAKLPPVRFASASPVGRSRAPSMIATATDASSRCAGSTAPR